MRVEQVDVQSTADVLPIQVAGHEHYPDELRLKYRFLDLRREQVHKNMMLRAGVIASLSVTHIQKRWSGFSTLARRAPYASGALMLLIALYMGVSGWISLTGGHLPQR